MRNELRIQLKESKSLIDAREAEVNILRGTLPGQRQEMRSLEAKYVEAAANWTSEIEFALENATREIGALDAEIKALYENQQLASVIKDLQAKRDELTAKMRELDTLIETLTSSQDHRKRDVALAITRNLSRLLKQDLHRQAEFRTAENVNFSFIDNLVTVDGSSKFSESSTVVLRHLFHMAMLSASTKIPEMRFPRFLMLDGIEDGGMEQARAYRLQEIILRECLSYDVDYQVIIATSQIAPELDKPEYVAGRETTEDLRALEIR